MASKTQVQKFINTVGKIALEEAKRRKAIGKKWILPGICVAQGACESAWGTSKKMINANALFGIKVGNSKWHFGNAWKDKAYSTKTKECYDGKTYVNITDMFRAYDSIADSVEDYMDILTSASRYASAANNTDALSTITAIKKGGYATAPDYISTIMKIYNTYPDIKALDSEFLGLSAMESVTYYPKCTLNTKSIVEALKSIGVDSSFANRKKIAEKNNIKGYIGTEVQNIKMLDLLLSGKLIKL